MIVNLKRRGYFKRALLISASAFAVHVVPAYGADVAPVEIKTAKLSSVQLEMQKRSNDMTVWHQMLMPNETYDIPVKPGQYAKLDGQLVDEPSWTAPNEAGNHRLEIFSANGSLARTLTVFVLEPSTSIDDRGYLGKYRIGFYPKNTPKGFIKLDKGEGALPVSPNFKVGQFLCKQQPGAWPKYVLVSADNLVRLETLLQDLNENRDADADTLFVMSGFRTPFYNTAIGSAKFSRHMYGDAADVYLDTKPRDGVMDDINRDGQITKADANFMYDYARALFKKEGLVQGGIGSYKANAVHGPFVHIDARGRAARWGR